MFIADIGLFAWILSLVGCDDHHAGPVGHPQIKWVVLGTSLGMLRDLSMTMLVALNPDVAGQARHAPAA